MLATESKNKQTKKTQEKKNNATTHILQKTPKNLQPSSRNKEAHSQAQQHQSAAIEIWDSPSLTASYCNMCEE